MSKRKKEQRNKWIRFGVTILGAGIMLCFANLSILLHITEIIYLIIVILIGLLIGLYSSELYFAILSAFFGIFMGFITFIGVILIPVAIHGSWALGELLIYIGITSVIRVLHLQLLGLLTAPIIGRLIGPDWYKSDIPKHKLRIGVASKSAESSTE